MEYFLNIKFYALCVDNINGYKRPSSFLRKFLYKFVINDRAAQFKRLSTEKIQTKLISGDNVGNNQLSIIIKKSDLLKKNLPDNYIWLSQNQIIDLINKQKIDIEARLLFGIMNFKDTI